MDGQLLAHEWWDDWHDIGPTKHLSAGNHQVKLEYFEGSGDAKVELSWARYSPTATPTQPSAGSWRVDYYNGKDLNWYASTDYESSSFIYHDWGTGSPGHGVGTDNFSIRYERTAYFNESGDWKFTIRSDDGFRLYVDGQLLAHEWWDGWHDIGPSRYLSAGDHQIKLEYFEGSGNAKVELSWARYSPTATPTPTNTPIPTGPTTLSMAPASGTYNINDEFDVGIDLSTGAAGDSMVDVWLTWDSARLQLVSAPPEANINGNRLYWPDTSCGPSRRLFTLRFRAIASGVASVQFDFTPGATNDCNVIPCYEIYDALDAVYDASFTIPGPTPTPTPTATPYTCNDFNEPNNSPDQASAISIGQTRSGIICPGGDYDYYQFTGVAGQRIVVDVDAQSIGSSLDSYLYLLDSDGSTVLALNDDEPTSLDSKLGCELPHDGTYYVRMRDYYSAGGDDYFYDLKVFVDDVAPSAQIISPGHNVWLDPNLQTITTDVNDNESGIRHVTFYWHDADWENSDWIVLNDDWYPSDGWTYDWDTSSIPEQQGGAVYIYAYDWAGNYAGWGSYNLGIDRTPPVVSAGVQQMYGDAPFLDFWVTWWDASDNLSGITSYDIQYRDGSGGTWTALLTGTTDTYYRFVGQDGHTYYFRTRARDYAGNMGTYASGDGDVEHIVQICPTSADAYEPDNSYTVAETVTTDGTWQSHNFHIDGDQDWVKFAATAGITYTLITTNTGGHADTVLYLYESDGNTLIDSNDDDPDNWPASRLEWGATRGGYLLRPSRALGPLCIRLHDSLWLVHCGNRNF